MRRFFKKIKAASTVEYGILLALIGIGIIVSIGNTGSRVGELFGQTENAIKDINDALEGPPASGSHSGEGGSGGLGAFLSGPSLYTLNQSTNPSACYSIYILNKGDQPAVNVEVADLTGDYSLCEASSCQGTLPTNTSCEIKIRGTSNTIGDIAGELKVTSENGGTVTTSITGTASTAPPGDLAIIGSQIVNLDQNALPGACLGLSFQNIGTGNLTIADAPIYTGGYGNQNCGSPTCSGALATGQTCQVFVQGTTAIETNIRGSVTLFATNGDRAKYYLEGVSSGFATARIVAGNTSVVNQTAIPGDCITISIRNDGGAIATGVQYPYVTGNYESCNPDGSGDCGSGAQTLVPNATCKIGVRGNRTTNGPLSGTAYVSSANGGTHKINLFGEASGL